MSALIVDTSAWIHYFKSKSSTTLDFSLKNGSVLIPSIVVAELVAGLNTDKERKSMIDFIEVLPIVGEGLEHWINVGKLRNLLKKRGYEVSTPDTHIAQCCIETGAYLLSYDKIFKKISNIIDLKLA